MQPRLEDAEATVSQNNDSGTARLDEHKLECAPVVTTDDLIVALFSSCVIGEQSV